MGGITPINYLNTFAILAFAYLAVFCEASFDTVRHWIGAQPDVIPSLMVYCGLTTGLVTLSCTALLAGLCFDSLSANPLGISVMPELLIGLIVYYARDLILREEMYTRFILGLAAGAAAPFLTILLLVGGGHRPLIGWGSLWQWVVLAVAGGVLTPVCFWFFDRVNAMLSYSRTSETTFRPDREIKRGRR